jgi:hypothetical protein
MKPILSRLIFAAWLARNLASGLPSKRYWPCDGRSSKPITFISVLLPQPLGPITATNSPLSIFKLTSSSARLVASPKPYSLLTSCSSIKAIYIHSLTLYLQSLQYLFVVILRYNFKVIAFNVHGGMQERFNWHAWKACVCSNMYRGFESLSLRQKEL